MNIPRIRKRRRKSNLEEQRLKVSKERTTKLLITSGLRLKEARIKCGLTISELSYKTKVTVLVIDSIEKGLLEALPESPYLSTMLRIIENAVGLKAGDLNGALLARKNTDQYLYKKPLKKFTPGAIDILRTWQGSVAYFIAISLSIIGLNYQQSKLAILNSYTLDPISLNYIQNDKKAVLLQGPEYSGLRPLEDAIKRSPLEWLNIAIKELPYYENGGELKIRFKTERTITIINNSGLETTIKGIKGSLLLKLKDPKVLRIETALNKNESIIWNEVYLRPEKDESNLFLIP